MESQDEIDRCTEFIDKYITPSTRYYKVSSYGLKHCVEVWGNKIDKPMYVHNDSFKRAMINAGYLPRDQNPINHYYKIKLLEKFF